MSKANIKTIKSELMANIICDAIMEEPYFNKEILIPKIKALIYAFKLNLQTTYYNEIKDPDEITIIRRRSELNMLEMNYWKKEIRKIIGEDAIQKHYECIKNLNH